MGLVYAKAVRQMFMGEYAHTIDSKGRLILPAKFREELGESCVLTRGVDNCLSVYTQEKWEAICNQFASIKTSDSKVRAARRFLFSSATQLEFDKQGRILVPTSLRQHAHLKKDAVIIGSGDRVEIWSKEQWEEYTNVANPHMESYVEELGDLGF